MPTQTNSTRCSCGIDKAMLLIQIRQTFDNAIAEVPVENNNMRWAILNDMKDRLTKIGLCAK